MQSLQSVLVVLVLSLVLVSSVVTFENSESANFPFRVPCGDITECGKYTQCAEGEDGEFCQCAWGTDLHPDCKNQCEAEGPSVCNLLIEDCTSDEDTGAATCACKFGTVEGSANCVNPCEGVTACEHPYTHCVPTSSSAFACRCKWGDGPNCKNQCEGQNPCHPINENCTPNDSTGDGICSCKFGGSAGESCVNPCDIPENVDACGAYSACTPVGEGTTNFTCSCKWGEPTSTNCKDQCEVANLCDPVHENCTPNESTGEGICSCKYGGPPGDSCVNPCDKSENTDKCGSYFDCAPLGDGTPSVSCTCKWGEEDEIYKPPNCKPECEVSEMAACGRYSKCSSNGTGYARCVCIRGTSLPPNCKDECLVNNPCDWNTEECTPVGNVGNATCRCKYGMEGNACKSPAKKPAESSGDINRFIVSYIILVFFSVVIW